MTKGAFPLIELDEATIAALQKRAPAMPLEGFRYAVSRFVAPSDNVTPMQVRDELGGKDSRATLAKLDGLPEQAARLQAALKERSLGASELLTVFEHRHGIAGLTERLERDLAEFLDLCEMARREAAGAVKPGRKPDANTELVRDLARALRIEGACPDASQGGALVQAFDLARQTARRRGTKCDEIADCAATVSKALDVLGKE
jgi:hypothetical protein